MACSWFRSGRARQAAKAAAVRGVPRVIRVTNESDGPLVNRLYSYWPNAWISGATIYVFVGHADGQVRFFSVERLTGVVTRLGALVPYGGTGEGWSWTPDGAIHLLDGPRLRRVNPFTGEDRIVFDISETHPGCDLWQSHSADGGMTHCATVRDAAHPLSNGAYPKIGTVVFSHGTLQFYGAQGLLDESQVTPDGRFLVIKEDDNNRVITIATGEERRISDADGAVGHSDCGVDILVGEDNQIGACVAWDLPTFTKRTLFLTDNMGYVAVRDRVCLHSGDTHLSLVDLTTGQTTPLVEHGGGTDYDNRVRANLSPCGRVATYMSNGTVYLLELP